MFLYRLNVSYNDGLNGLDEFPSSAAFLSFNRQTSLRIFSRFPKISVNRYILKIIN